MKFLLKDIHLPLASFPLELDLEMQGNAIAILGPNGSGKTSLLDLIAGLRKPRTAFIQLDDLVLADTHVSKSLPPQQRGIGYVPQEQSLFPHLSVLRNITYGRSRTGHASHFSVAHVADVLEISPLLESSIATISGGERQRVALARAILSHPRLLLLDEPLSYLDRNLKAKSLDLLLRIRTEFSIPMLYVSHSMDEITAICDEQIHLEAGRLVGRG